MASQSIASALARRFEVFGLAVTTVDMVMPCAATLVRVRGVRTSPNSEMRAGTAATTCATARREHGHVRPVRNLITAALPELTVITVCSLDQVHQHARRVHLDRRWRDPFTVKWVQDLVERDLGRARVELGVHENGAE